MCDHTIMLSCLDREREQFVTLSEVSKKCREASDHSKEFAEIFEWCKPAEPKDYVDGRKGYSTLFKFCPFCGEHINWKKVRAAI